MGWEREGEKERKKEKKRVNEKKEEKKEGEKRKGKKRKSSHPLNEPTIIYTQSLPSFQNPGPSPSLSPSHQLVHFVCMFGKGTEILPI